MLCVSKILWSLFSFLLILICTKCLTSSLMPQLTASLHKLQFVFTAIKLPFYKSSSAAILSVEKIGLNCFELICLSCIFFKLFRGFAKLNKIQKNGYSSPHPPTHPLSKFCLKPITAMERTLNSL